MTFPAIISFNIVSAYLFFWNFFNFFRKSSYFLIIFIFFFFALVFVMKKMETYETVLVLLHLKNIFSLII